MGKVVDLTLYRRRSAEQQGFGPWRKRFGESYGEKTRLSDLSHNTLYALALPGEAGAEAYYEMIMGLLGLGPAVKFTFLEQTQQMRVVDMHLFMADQVRFEMMRRLGWLTSIPCGSYSIMEIVDRFDEIRTMCRETPPELAETHEGYGDYIKLHPRDGESFVRRLLADALDQFKDNMID